MIDEEILKEEFVKNFENKLYIQKCNKDFSQIVFLCVGTDRVIGDAIGPLVGSKLKALFKNYNIFNINIYGSLKDNVNYINVQDTIKKINNYHKDACIIVIDSALSKKENIGKIFVSNAKTMLGKGLNKNKVEVGDISIKAVVGKDLKITKYNFKNLQDISLGLILDLSETLANGIFEVIKYA